MNLELANQRLNAVLSHLQGKRAEHCLHLSQVVCLAYYMHKKAAWTH
jgi:hypothetical protein